MTTTQIYLMNNTLFPFLARSFCRIQGLGLLFFLNNYQFPLLARNFGLVQGFIMNIPIPFLARNFGSNARLLPFAIPESYRCTSRISKRQVTQQLTKITAKKKTKPKQTHSNPIFWRSNPILSPKTRIFDKFRQTFLCKTNPIYKNLHLSMRYHLIQKMQNEPNLNIFLISSAAVDQELITLKGVCLKAAL